MGSREGIQDEHRGHFSRVGGPDQEGRGRCLYLCNQHGLLAPFSFALFAASREPDWQLSGGWSLKPGNPEKIRALKSPSRSPRRTRHPTAAPRPAAGPRFSRNQRTADSADFAEKNMACSPSRSSREHHWPGLGLALVCPSVQCLSWSGQLSFQGPNPFYRRQSEDNQSPAQSLSARPRLGSCSNAWRHPFARSFEPPSDEPEMAAKNT